MHHLNLFNTRRNMVKNKTKQNSPLIFFTS